MFSSLKSRSPCRIRDNNSNWAFYEFTIDVQLPSSCPLRLVTHPTDKSFATVLETAFEEPTDDVIIAIRDANNSLISAGIDDWAFDSGVWEAGLTGMYPAGSVGQTGRDTAAILTWMRQIDDVKGGVNLPYTHEIGVMADGTQSAAPYELVDVQADVMNADGPAQYQWYLDGDPVGSNSPTLWINISESGQHFIEVRVTDAEGDVGWGFHSLVIQ